MKKVLISLLLLLLCAGCAAQENAAPAAETGSSPSPAAASAAETAPSEEYDPTECRPEISAADTAAKLLSEAGLRGEMSAYEETAQSLTGESYRYALGEKSEWISVYLYADAESAEADAACVSADGFGYDDGNGHAVQIDWIAPPHYHQKDNIIFRYVGTDETVIDALTEAFGEPFAGGK